MKKLIVVLLGLTYFGTAWAQVSRKSAVMTFNFSDHKTSLSRTSNTLKFGSSNQTSISSVSQVLSFGSPNGKNVAAENNVAATNPTHTTSAPQVKKEPEVSPVIALPKEQDNAITQNPPESQRAVAEVEKKIEPRVIEPAGSKELGEDYATSIPKYRALIFGVSDYKYAGPGLPALTNPTIDAQSLYTVLTTKYAFDTANVKYLKNPTRRQIIDAFETLSYDVNEKDNLLVFYAGHGYYDKEKEFGYWLPSDAKASSRSDWIPNSTIKDYLSAIKSKHTLLITDACFGGSIFKTRSVEANTIVRIHELYKDPSRKAITSGNLSEVPDKSPFIEFLLKKLNENEDKYMPAQKLYTRIFEPVSNNSSATPQFGVIQGAGDQGGDFIFIKKN